MVLPFHLPPSPQMSLPCSSDSSELSLSENDTERLKQFDQRVQRLGHRNPFAAALVLDLAYTIMKFFDA